jgi:RecA-family ATPase
VAFAEGHDWLGHQCQQTDVLYINLELKAESRRKRMRDIYQALGIRPDNAARIHSMDLRGKNVTLESLTAKLVKQAITHNCKVIIIDPIYKVLDGDENSSEDVSRFCVALDYLIERLGASVIYCHHYSKGAYTYSASMNRASGSSVFSRDADALLTMDELELSKDRRAERFCTLGKAMIVEYMDAQMTGWQERLKSIDDILVLDALRPQVIEMLGIGTELANTLIIALNELEATCMETMTAWRVEGTLRDFPRFKTTDIWFQWPLHIVDNSGLLADAAASGQTSSTAKKSSGPNKKAKAKAERLALLKEAVDAFKADSEGTSPTLQDIADYIDRTPRTVRKYAEESGIYTILGSLVVDKPELG